MTWQNAELSCSKCSDYSPIVGGNNGTMHNCKDIHMDRAKLGERRAVACGWETESLWGPHGYLCLPLNEGPYVCWMHARSGRSWSILTRVCFWSTYARHDPPHKEENVSKNRKGSKVFNNIMLNIWASWVPWRNQAIERLKWRSFSNGVESMGLKKYYNKMPARDELIRVIDSDKRLNLYVKSSMRK